MNLAWICYPTSYSDDNEDWDLAPVIVFEEPPKWKYRKVIPIAFSVLKEWKEK